VRPAPGPAPGKALGAASAAAAAAGTKAAPRGAAGACRLGLRYLRGLREEAAARIVGERARAPFASLDDLARRCQLHRDELAVLAQGGALAGFGLSRRAALWQVARIARPAGPLFVELGDVEPMPPPGDPGQELGHVGESTPLPAADGAAATDSPSSDAWGTQRAYSPLPELSPLGDTLADYVTSGLTVGRHPLSFLRPTLTREGVRTAAELPQLAHGSRVAFGGAVIVRQRPGTAKGTLFMTLEDETGMAQAIVAPELFRAHRRLIVGTPGLIVEGVLQHRDGSMSVRAERFRPLPTMTAAIPSHDFH
jgi:error-prone DNA polymerase